MTRWASPQMVSAALAGDTNAVDELVGALWPACYRLAMTVAGDPGLAQDAAQESCAIVHRRIRGLRNPEAFDAWVYRIVMREAARVRRRNPPAFEPSDRPSPASDSTATIDVWRALGDLPPDQRDVVVLFYFDDLKSEEIAAILRVPHATVRTRLARAREKLRGTLDDYRSQPTVNREMKQHAF